MLAFAPWRSVLLARLTTVAALIVGVPVFLRMPPWCDLTLYDVAARNLLSGGTHYRDVFDTNMPGFVWCLAGLRAALGWSVEAVRAADLLIVAGIVLLMDRLAKGAGANRSSRAWAIAGVAAFYPFTTEFVHAQRDVWMLLPALAAVLIRCRRMNQQSQPKLALAEGMLWGVAVWIKPHVIVPAAAVWLATTPRISGLAAKFKDLLGNLLGGLLLGAAGVSYLLLSGTWPHFVEVFTVWNTQYAATMFGEFGPRALKQFDYFPGWSLLHIAGIPVAIFSLLEGITTLPRRLWSRAESGPQRLFRTAFASLYLGWLVQAVLLQREFHYVHIPETLLVLGLLATQRWAAGFLMIAALTLTSLAVLAGASLPTNVTGLGPDQGKCWAILHPAYDSERQAVWPDCWKTGLAPEEYRRRQMRVALIRGFHAANDWQQLGEVADWLRAQGVKDGEVIAWHDAPHAIYLDLGIRPGFRFQHVSHMEALSDDHCERLHAELQAALPGVRFVVSDLMRCGAVDKTRTGDTATAGADLLPISMRADVKKEFPYCLRAVYRSGAGTGRYVVHIVK